MTALFSEHEVQRRISRCLSVACCADAAVVTLDDESPSLPTNSLTCCSMT